MPAAYAPGVGAGDDAVKKGRKGAVRQRVKGCAQGCVMPFASQLLMHVSTTTIKNTSKRSFVIDTN